MIEKKEILDTINNILKKEGAIWWNEEINYETKIGEFGSIGMDSLDYWDLIMELEQKYDISIPDEDVYKFKTVNDIIDFIYKEKQG